MPLHGPHADHQQRRDVLGAVPLGDQTLHFLDQPCRFVTVALRFVDANRFAFAGIWTWNGEAPTCATQIFATRISATRTCACI